MNHSKKFYFNLKTIASLGIILLMISCSISTNTQSQINISDVHYEAKIGDQNTYDVVKVDTLNSEPYKSYFTLKSGSEIFYILTKGDKFINTIDNFNPDAQGALHAYLSSVLITTNNKIFFGPEVIDAFPTFVNSYTEMLYPAFENQSIAFSYFNQTDNILFDNTSIEGNFIIITSDSFFMNLTTTQTTYKYNWKTGWLESEHFYTIFTNGTVYSDILIEQESTNSVNRVVGINISFIKFIELGSIFALIIITLFLAISYKKYNKSKIKQGNDSFFTFIKMKVKKGKKKKDKQKKFSGHETEKALEKIDEILEENSDQ